MRLASALVCAIALSVATPAHARDPSPGYVSLDVENDVFASNNDRDFTHGTEVEFMSGSLPGTHDVRAGFNLGQALYTPKALWMNVPDPQDRPYAGWLYAAADLVVETDHAARGPFADRSLDELEVSFGVVGPAAGARIMQQSIHTLLHIQLPRGWAYELQDEPTELFSYEYVRRVGVSLGRHLEVDATPNAGVMLGNVFTTADVGLTLRIGNHMLDDFGPPRMRPSAGAGSAFLGQFSSGFGWYVFGGVAGRAVLRNMFLDGNSFEASARVDKLPFVGDAQLGFALTFHGVRVSYTYVVRSREFRGPEARVDEFGAISVSARL